MNLLIRYHLCAGLFILGFATGCKKYLDVPLPISAIAGASVFENDNTSGAALNSIYAALYNQGNFDGNGGVGYLTGVYGDELRNLSILPSNLALYGDGVSSSIGGVTGQWTTLYNQLYSVNLGIESLTGATGLTYKDQWLGEAYFLRGLIYFYLTNLYGDVPLVVSSNYQTNNTLARSAQTAVYAQIVSDLTQAQSLLSDVYHDGGGAVTTDRARPNRMAATALLARVYLYNQEWPQAEVQADSVIANGAYQLTTPGQTFLVGSPELIWGIEPSYSIGTAYIEKDAVYYYIPPGTDPVSDGIAVCLSDSLLNAFEPGDARYTNWVGTDTVPASGTIYHYAHKYQAIGTYTTAQESIALFRLAEQYLIRAEARAEQGNLAGAASDLNVVRTRAGLPATTAATQVGLLLAIGKERRVEFFTESGQRFFDLRRTGALDALMTSLAPQKGGSWVSFKEWWPIPVTDIQNDTHLTQTPGYQ